ncbi:hypothetical protein KL86PLE_40251 [uncultured Pleomorphomonas sp.]|uniref:Uncharacterized protein n=1 Tax=uncultured Pleomorphomonas sp. TaxID=442121 RepID=A0A212LFU6_9HYPH|nr:hypothetical protein KL86PLE_40251 [uncultured Pleomorphomonas sp.]
MNLSNLWRAHKHNQNPNHSTY